MASLTSCMKKAGKALREDDRAAMTARFNALTNAGTAVADAARQAVDEQIATVQKALQRVEGGPAPAESAAKAQAKADLMAGLGDLGSLLSKGTRANITPEEEQQLLPILTKVMDAAFRLGYLKFKDAAKFVLDQIRSELGEDIANAVTLDHMQGAYIGMSGRHKDKPGVSSKRDVIGIEDKAEIEAHQAQAQEEEPAAPAAAERPAADGVTRATAGGQQGINGEWYEGGQILPTSKDTVKGEQTRPSGPRSEPAPAVDTSVQSTPESALSGSGLVVEEKTAQSGKKYWAVSGNTREHESVLDALGFGKPFKMGGKWYRSVRDGDPTEKLAAALSGNMPTPAPAVERPSLSAEEAAPILRQFKVEVSGSGDAWIVTGKTFDIKEAIKDTGGRWNGQAWAYTQDPTGTLAAALKERGSAGNAGDDAGAGQSDAEIARRRELRQREDARPDERADAGRVAEQVDQQTQALILRGEKYGIPRKVLSEQIEDIGLIVNAHAKGKPLFLLANEAGTGKTMVLGGAIRELRARGEKKFVYVTMNTDLIAQIKKDLADYGVDDVSFHTYSELSGKGFDTGGAILIFDEAHNVKNVGAETARADKAQDLMAAAKMNILASATLFENPVEARYLASTGIFDTVGGFSEWAKTYGASVKVRKFYNPNTGRQQTEEIIYWAGRGKKEDGAAARQWLFKQAIMTQRAMSIDPGLVDVQFSRNAVDQHWVDTYQTVADAYDAAEDAWKDEQGNPRDAKIVAEIARHRENTIKRVLEAAKIPHAISEAKSLIAAGRNVVIFVETKADRHLGKWKRLEHFKDDTLYSYDQMQELMAEWDLEARMARMQNEKAPPRPFAPFIVEIARFFDAAGIDMELPSTADQITAAIGADKVAMYTGAVANTAAAKNKTDFMAGRKPLLVATMAKGGTGLSLHDTVGNRPTTQLNINLPWKATGVDQVAARVARYGLRSRAEVRWLFAANIPWESTKLAPRVGARMRDMGAIVKGIEVKGAEILDGAFDFEGDIDAKGGSAIVPGAVDSDIYARAKRMEQMRRKADDTSNGFFETPYPLAALMANVGGVRVGQSLLEPSGGRGNLLRLLPEGMNITAVELRQDNRDALARLVPDAKLVPGDFMAFEGGSFDTVLMNPPFERVAEVGAQDVAHVQRAYGMLAPGGRLVAIMGEGAFFREYKQETAFRGWLDDVGATVIQMPEGAFKQSGTGVRTRMVVIDRDGEPGRTDINLHDMEIESLRAVERQVPSRYAVAAAEASLPAESVDAEPASQFEADQTPTPPAPAAEIDKPEAAAIVQQAETLPPAKPEAATVDAAEESEAQETAAAEKIADFGAKIGGARKDTAKPLGSRGIAYAGDTTAIQQAVDVITDQWENAPPVTVVHSMQDSRLPQAIRDEDARQRLNGSTGEPTGVFFNGRVYIVASAVRNDAEVARVLFHEGLGHFGLRGAFGSSLDKILDQMATLNRPAVAQKAKEYGFDMANQAQRRRAAEEVLAELAETRPTSSWVQKAIAAIRTWLRKNLPGVFGDMEFSDAEIVRNFLVPARGFVERGRAMEMPNATPAFIRAEMAVWYSELARQIQAVGMNAAPANGWLQWLKGLTQKGVKPDEIAWSGIEDWLQLQTGKVSREQLAAYMDANGVQVRETVLSNAGAESLPEGWRVRRANLVDGMDSEMEFVLVDENDEIQGAGATQAEALQDGWDPDVAADMPAKYSQYTLPGGTNYREVLLTLPGKPLTSAKLDGLLRDMDALQASYTEANVEQMGDLSDAIHAEREKLRRADEATWYKSGHWDQANVLAHIRVNDRTDASGARVLFVEEVQSDWGQAGKKHGFKSAKRGEAPEGFQIVDDADDARRNGMPVPAGETGLWFYKGPGITSRIYKTREEAISAAWADFERGRGQAMPPAAPFVGKTDAWVGLSLKRIVKMAVDGGYDKVAFVTGEQSAARYDLSQHIDRIHYEKADDGRYELVAYKVGSRDDSTGSEVLHEDEIDLARIEALVGKEIAQKIADEAGENIGGPYRNWRELKGVDLKVGGEGMKAFYDRIVPAVTKDVLRKLGGGALETVNIGRPASRYKVTQDSGGSWMAYNPADQYDFKEFESETAARQFAAGTDGTAQPGFTITDAMRQKAAGGMPMFARRRTYDATTTEAGWEMPGSSRFDDFVYRVQDKNIDLKRAIAAIKADGKAMEDRLDAYLQEELFHGRAAKRTQDFVSRELEPLLKDMAARQVSVDELELYLHARHAEEANKVIAQRNKREDDGQTGIDGKVITSPLQDGGSGMLTADARAHLAGLDPAKRSRLEALAARVDAMIEKTRQAYIGYGLESKATVDGWTSMFEHYIPLMREDKEGGMGIGQGFSIKGPESKHRTGSTARVVDILSNIALQRERAIVRGEKNRVAVALAGLVKLNPNPDIWSFGPITERRYNKDNDTVETFINGNWKNAANVMVAKIPGKDGKIHEVGIVFNEDNDRAQRMAMALKNLDAAQLEGVLGLAAKVTRYFASVNTQYNPVFGAVNLVRDVQGAAINLGSTALKGHKAAVVANIPAALRAVYRIERGKSVKNQAMSDLWYSLQNEGGMTGFRDQFRTSQERAEAIRYAMDPTNWTESKMGRFFTAGGVLKVPMVLAQKALTPVFAWLTDYNQAMEGATRLAAYKVALDQGLSKQQAASIAKNLTVNFNRKGQAGAQAGALYAFFNASVQGTARMGEVLIDTKGGQGFGLKTGAKLIVGGGVLLGSIQAALLAAAGFDDDEPPDFVRERNIIIPTGWVSGKKDYITIPMPLGWHLFPNLGRLATEFALGGFKDPGKRALKMAALTAESFNPMGSTSTLLQFVMPTPLDPLAALAENKDWTGKPIARRSFDQVKPGFAQGKDTASSPAKWIAEAVNWMSGGTKHTAGALSPTPDQIDFLWAQATGGVGREASKAEQSVTAAFTGEALPPHKIPLIGRFYGDVNSSSSQASKFYENIRRMNEHEAMMKGLSADLNKASDPKDVADARKQLDAYKADHPEAVLFDQADRTERLVRGLRSQKRELLAKGAPAADVRKNEATTTTTMKSLNDAVQKAEKPAPAKQFLQKLLEPA